MGAGPVQFLHFLILGDGYMIFKEEFQNPPVEYRIKPFWFWNGDITKEEISHQIKEMADKGLGGMFICARQGMTIPYLSKEWFEMVEYACAEARRYGLEAWLYDEYPYPSGMSGGEVLLEHPEAEHMILVHKKVEKSRGGEVEVNLGWSRVLFAKAYPVDKGGNTCWDEAVDLKDCIGNLQQEKIYQQTGLTKYNNKRFFSYGPSKILKTVLPELAERTWRIELYMEMAMGDFKYYGGFFDPCNKEAVRTFLETTHERYEKAVGDQFGITVHGMFSDEVGLLSPIPWSKLLPEEFEKRNGYSLLDCMPALHDDSFENAMKVRYDLYETAHILFRTSYHKQVSDWCREHHLQYATEVPSMRHSTQRYSDIVGGDTAHEKLGKPLEWIYDEYIHNYRSNAKAVSSLARQLGKKYAMIESFHSVGWTMTLQDAKWMIDRLGSSGINLYNFHAFYYTIQDITKHDAPPSQFLQNPYWKYYRKLADYVGRMGVMVTNTDADIQIAVLDPVAALWTKLGNPFHGFPYRGESEREQKKCDYLRERWVHICKTLLFNQLDYDHLDAEMLEDAEISDGKIHLGKAAYSVVILPPCHCMESYARNKLEEFTAQGGTVIGIEEIPTYAIDGGENNEETKERWKLLFEKPSAFFFTEMKDDELIQLCREQIDEHIHCRIISGNPKDTIVSVRYDENGNWYVFAANQGKERIAVELTCDYKCTTIADKNVYRLDLETGKICNIPVEENAVVIRLGSFESQWIQISNNGTDNKISHNSIRPEITIPLDAEWKMKPLGKNFCRFGYVDMSLNRIEWENVEVKTFIEQCDSTKLLEKQQLRFSGAFGTPKKITPAYPLACWYRVEFQMNEVPEDICIFMDRETMAGSYQLFINGKKADQKDWYDVFVNDKNNQALNIYSMVKEGKNSIEIQMNIEKDEDGLRDPLYLWGSFGVTETAGIPLLTKQPETGCPDRHWCKGFPYYSGTMEYETCMKLEIPVTEQQVNCFDIKLGFQGPTYDCIETRINGVSLGVKAYTPYVWQCPRDVLQKDENIITIAVTNTLANMLDGTYFDYDSQKLVNIEP